MMADEAEHHDTLVGHVRYSNMVICFLRAASPAALRDLMTVRVHGDAVPFAEVRPIRRPQRGKEKAAGVIADDVFFLFG